MSVTTFTYVGGSTSTSSDTTLTSTSYGNNTANLVSVQIGSIVTSLSDRCFVNCRNLTSITFDSNSSVTSLGDSCFQSCSNLTSITIPNSVTSLGTYCFVDCISLTSISIPDSVTSLGFFCFQSCTGLTSITIPSSVTSLGYECFYNCTSLKSFIFNDQSKLTSIQFSTFSSCPSMSVTYYLTNDENALSSTSKSLQTQFPSGSTFNYYSGVSCFNKGTKILCLNKKFEEEYIPIENLRKGDFVKSYKHGYRKIELIGKNLMINNPDCWYVCMYKMEKNDTNGVTEDLIITGGHAILVDDLKEYKEENDNKFCGETPKIDEKYLLLSSVSKDFVKLENTNVYTYYHFILENNGNDDERFGVWANGILTETPSKNLLISAINKGNYNINY